MIGLLTVVFMLNIYHLTLEAEIDSSIRGNNIDAEFVPQYRTSVTKGVALNIEKDEAEPYVNIANITIGTQKVKREAKKGRKSKPENARGPTKEDYKNAKKLKKRRKIKGLSPGSLAGKFEGDMMLTPKQRRMMSKRTHGRGKKFASRRRKSQLISGISGLNFVTLWPGGIVPFEFNANLTKYARAAFVAALTDMRTYSCIKWVLRRNHTNYVQVIDGTECYSTVGMIGGKQTLSLGPNCDNKRTALHEMMHALGFAHEHTRPDRRKFVKINLNNAWDKTWLKINRDRVTFQYNYDYYSVMHYASTAYSKSYLPTIVPTYVSDWVIGSNDDLSHLDIVKINELYNCSSYYGCMDTIKRCERRATQGQCTNDTTMQIFCPKSCSQCAENGLCFDNDQMCPIWKKFKDCVNKKKPIMLQYCRRSCSMKPCRKF